MSCLSSQTLAHLDLKVTAAKLRSQEIPKVIQINVAVGNRLRHHSTRSQKAQTETGGYGIEDITPG